MQWFCGQRFGFARLCAYCDGCLWRIYVWHWPKEGQYILTFSHFNRWNSYRTAVYNTDPFSEFLIVVLMASIYKLCHYVNNSTEFNQSPSDVWNEYSLYNWQVMYLLTICMKECLKQVTIKSQFMLVFHTKHTWLRTVFQLLSTPNCQSPCHP